MLELQDIGKRYRENIVLREISLTIPEGSTTVLIGPSGCGKSTLIRVINGLVRSDTGTVRFMEQEVNVSSAPALRRRMGYVIQEGGLFPHLTALGNVGIMARHLGWSRERIARRVEELTMLTRFPSDTLGALTGAGGYGQPILTGIRLDDTGMILMGAVPAALLAQGLFELLERQLVPRGLRAKARG